MSQDSVIGSHTVKRYGDLMQMRMRGPLTEADVVGMRDVVREIRRECRNCFLVADVVDLSNINADARRMMAKWGRTHPEDRASGVAVYGVNFVTRTLITLTVNAVRLLGYREVELKCTSNEAESLRWIDAQRGGLAGEPEIAG